MSITPEMVKDLREKTGAGIMDCKTALKEANGDYDKAVEFLRKKGAADASKKKDRVAKEGGVFSYIHHSGKTGVLLEINCETDFVARTDKFQGIAKDITMHIAAADPQYLNRVDVPEETLKKEMEIFAAQFTGSGKPQEVINRIVSGKMEKFYSDTCLMDQLFVKDDSKHIKDIISGAIAELGENIVIRRFVRFQLGA